MHICIRVDPLLSLTALSSTTYILHIQTHLSSVHSCFSTSHTYLYVSAHFYTPTASDTEVRATPIKKDSNADKNAAIALGVLFGLLLIGSVILIARMRKSNRRLSKELSKAQGTSFDWNTTKPAAPASTATSTGNMA